MDIKITKKQNVKVNGVKYGARNKAHGCEGCAFDAGSTTEGACYDSPCYASQRDDGRSVIFVKKEPKA